MSTGKPFVFVLMPFASDFDDIYKFGIKQTCEQLGCYCERVDEQIFQDSILDRIYNQISKADILIADMSGRNPNVFYEVGYAHGLGKKVILLTQKTDDIPFDFKHFQHIVYGGSAAALQTELTRTIRWIIENPEKQDEALLSPLEVYCSGKKVFDGMAIDCEYDSKNGADVALEFTVVNQIARVARTERIRILFEYPKGFRYLSTDCEFARSSVRSDREMCQTVDTFELIPGSFMRILCYTAFFQSVDKSSFIIMHLLRESGALSYNILLVPLHKNKQGIVS
jgi:hypothetical protein